MTESSNQDQVDTPRSKEEEEGETRAPYQKPVLRYIGNMTDLLVGGGSK